MIQWNLEANTQFFKQENAFQYVVWENIIHFFSIPGVLI